MNNKYTVVDLFAGVGGLSKAFHLAGANIAWANDIERNACNLYKENLECDCVIEGDIKILDAKTIPDFDILVAGFPCQSFSFSGERRNYNNGRNYLIFDILRVLKEKKPRAFLLESVKALLSFGGVNALRTITDALIQEGYCIKYQVLNSMNFGNIPHKKERLYIIGFKEQKECEKFEFPNEIQVTRKINDIIDIKEQKDNRYYLGKSIELIKRNKGDILKKEVIYQLRYEHGFKERYIVKEYEFCPPLSSITINVPLIFDNFGIRKLTPLECFKFQGYFDIKIPTNFSDRLLYKYAAGCSAVTVVKRIADNIIGVLEQNVQCKEAQNLFSNNYENSMIEIKREMLTNGREEPIPNDSSNDKIEQNSLVVDKKESSLISNDFSKKVPENSEKEFTIQKVIPALKKKNFLDVKYTHGNDEYGKDVTYKYLDNFGITKYGAVQVKYGDISGSANGDIDTILSQICDAFDMTYTDLKERRRNNINQLLIVCSGRYTRNAKEKILGKIKKGYDILFFDGQDIDNLLE